MNYIYPLLSNWKQIHHKLILSKLMKKTKLTNCKFELHVKVKTQSAGTKCNNITTLRRSIALRLGPNLRAIAPWENSELNQNLPAFIHKRKSDVVPKLAYKRNKHRAVARISKLQEQYKSSKSSYPRLRPQYLCKMIIQQVSLICGARLSNWRLNYWSCRTVITVVPVEQLAASKLGGEIGWSSELWWESRGRSQDCGHPLLKTSSATSLSPCLLFRGLFSLLMPKPEIIMY